MQRKILTGAEQYTKRSHRRRIWNRIVSGVACVVVFFTTYALILPAITMEQSTFCGLIEHSHEESCYVQIKELSCGQTAEDIHVHSDACYLIPDTEPVLEVHTHDEKCYTVQQGDLICQIAETEGHAHGGGCYTPGEQLACQQEESEGHTHSADCGQILQTCSLPEDESHSHAGDCTQTVMVCGLIENQGHAHTQDCYVAELICAIAEEPAHQHGEVCYVQNQVLSCIIEEGASAQTYTEDVAEAQLICMEADSQPHEHSDACTNAAELTCTLEENETHTHNFLCYGTWELICPKEEHEHELVCFSDPEADVETEEVWKRTFKDVELTGVWADDVLAIAKTQLGYTESTRNYVVWEDGSTHGYTRYGDWYGSPYGDWCAMFVSFCIHYADVDTDAMPLNWGCRTWIADLSKPELDFYRVAGEYDPKPGDLIFFDWEDEYGNSDDLSDHVGLVAEVVPATDTEPARIKTIEGNSSNCVQYVTYKADDTEILGYGIMPENPNPESDEETDAVETVPTGLYTYFDENLYVEVQLPEDTEVPADAVLTVTPIAADHEKYEGYVARAGEAVDGTVSNIVLYDISFYTADGSYYPVSDTAKISLRFAEPVVDINANVQVLHFAEEDGIPEVIAEVTVEEKEVVVGTTVVEETPVEETAPAEEAPAEETAAEVSAFALRRSAEPEAVAEAEAPAETEPETVTEPITEIRTVVEFTTNGFSTFAVVEVQTGTYVARVLKDAEVQGDNLNNLGGRTFVISPGFVYEIDGFRYALTNEQVIVHETNEGGYHEYERLKAGAVQYDNTTLTTPADDGFLWNFIKVEGKDNTYYVQSVETGRYLYIGAGRTVKTTATPNEIVVAHNSTEGDNGRVTLMGENGYYLRCTNESNDEGIKVFSSVNGGGWNELFLAEYSGETSDEALTQWPLDGRQLVISRQLYNGNNTAVLTKNAKIDGTVNILAAVNRTATTDANGNIVSVVLNSGDLDSAVWEFTAVEGKPNTYHIQLVGGGGYLNLNTNHDLTVGAEPQDIELYSTNNGNTVAFRIPGAYVHLYGNDVNRGFGCWEDYSNECYLSLTEYASTDLDGRFFVIANQNAVAITSVNAGMDPGDDNNGTGVELLKAESVTLDGEIPVNTVWKFTAVEGKINTYYIQPAYEGENGYLNITTPETAEENHASLTVGNIQQAIEVVPYGDGMYLIRLPDNNYCVNLFGGNINRGFGVWNGIDTDNSPLVLTEYAPTDLNGRRFIISKPLDEDDTAVMTVYGAQENQALFAVSAKYALDENGNPVPTEDAEIGNDILWQFEAVEGSNSYTYYIKAINAQDQNIYLNIAAGNDNVEGSLTVGANPQAIEVVNTNGNRVALRGPGTIAGTYCYVSLDSITTDEAINYFFDISGAFSEQSTLVLTEYPIPNQVPDEEKEGLVTNLADQMYIICAVDSINYPPAVVTDVATNFNDNDAYRLGLETTAANADNGISINNGDGTVTFSDANPDADYSRMIWKFLSTDTPGVYYIQSQSAANGGKYLHLDATGATLNDNPQAIEVVLGTNTNGWNNVVCLRVTEENADGTATTRYLNLCQNNPDLGATTYANAGTENNGNHFILAQLSGEAMAAIKAITDPIDALPAQEEIVTAVRDLRNANADSGAYQAAVIAAAKAAIDAYKAAEPTLTPEQKVFIGADRISKLEELEEWLIGTSGTTEDGTLKGRLPNVVDAANATGVTVKVFDYTSAVMDEQFYTDGFTFFSVFRNDVDGAGELNGVYTGDLNDPDITFKLNEAGYPVLVDKSPGGSNETKEIDLSNLFNGKYQQGTMTNGGGLFRQDEDGYYFYYSDMNAAYYDQEEKQFILYDTIVRPSNIWWSNANANENVLSDRRSNFLPFNELINPDGTGSIVYDSEDHQDANATGMVDKHDLNLPGEPNQVPTAILNDPTDLWFGMNMEFDFFMPKGGKVNNQDMVFDFHGDDDVLIFIDGVLVLDLGGTHAAWDGNINFATGAVYSPRTGSTTLKALFMKAAGVTDENVTSVTIKQPDGTDKVIRFNGNTLADYSAHNLKFFYMERGGTISYCGMKFNLPTLPENSLMVRKEASSPEDANSMFNFRVIREDTRDVFFTQGTTYTIMENGVELKDPGTVGADGIFSLKPGQGALFSNILDGITGDPPKLIVQEVLPSGETYSVAYQLSSDGVYRQIDKDSGNTENFIYSTTEINPTSGSEIVTFYNTPAGSGTLSITKQMAVGESADENEIFYVRVKMGQNAADTLIPVGTKYHVGDDTRTVVEAGIIPLKAGETATIIGITPGLYFEVAEFLTDNQNYKPTYHVDETDSDGTQPRDSSKVTGIIQEGEEVKITIENDPYDQFVNLPISKEVKPAGVPDNFYFLVDQVTNSTGQTPVEEYRPGILVRVDANGKSDANILIGIEGDDPGPWYFKVYEEAGTGDYYYDPTFYVVEVKLQNDKAVITNVWKNGTEAVVLADNYSLPFVNRKFTELTVMKTVIGDTGGTFYFDVNVTVDGVSYPVKDISLSNNETATIRIPYGAEVTVTETNSDGYSTHYEVYSRYEAEDGVVSNGATIGGNTNVSGGKYVQNIVPDNGVDSLKLFPNMLSSGDYNMRLRYNMEVQRSFTVTANNGEKVEVLCSSNGTWYEVWSYIYSSISLKEGANTISIRGTTDYAPNLDYVDIVWQEENAGTSVTQSVVADNITIHFTNAPGYELPETGGAGTYLYTMGGLLLMAAAAILLYYHTKRGKEEHASS